MLLADARTTRRIGAVTLALLALGVGFIVFAWDRIEWTRPARIHVRLHATGGLREGAPFVVAGRAIGHVETIALVGDPDGGVDITVAVPPRAAAAVPAGGDVFVASKGAFGAKYLELGPAPAPAAGARPVMLADGDRFVGRDPPGLDRVLQRTWDDLSVARDFAAAVRPEAEALVAAVAALAETLEGLAPDGSAALALRIELVRLGVEVAQLRATGLGGEAGFARAVAVVEHGAATLALARQVLATLAVHARALQANGLGARDRLAAAAPALGADLDRAVTRLQAAIAALDPVLAQVTAIRDRLARGEGSLGRLMTDPEFPEDAKELGKLLKRHPWRALLPSRP